VTALAVADTTNPGKWAAHDVQRFQTSCAGTDTDRLYSTADEAEVQAQLTHTLKAIGEIASVHAPGDAQSGRLSGTVTEWNPRGFGFIQFSDSRRAYVHNSQCSGQHLSEGEVVSATCVEDIQNPGKWQATNILRDSDTGEDGVVTDWKEEGGFGFLSMLDGRRAYIHRSAFGGKGSLTNGMKLRVTTKPDPRNPGKWCIEEVKGVVAEEPVSLAATTATMAAVAAPPNDQELSSCIVDTWDARGFGFVKTDDGRRAYVHNSSCGGLHLQQGQAIYAQIVPDPQNPGKWAATNVHEGSVATSGELGTVTDWNDQGGFGFLSMDDGRRAYVHRNAFGGKGSLSIGSKLQVSTKPDPRNPGKWCVDEVTGELVTEEVMSTGGAHHWEKVSGSGSTHHWHEGSMAPEPSSSVVSSGGDDEGTVTDWHDAGGYGFLSMDDGKRAYIHRNSFGGKGSLTVGSRLRVTTKPDPRNPGKWSVDQVLAESEAQATDSGYGFSAASDQLPAAPLQTRVTHAHSQARAPAEEGVVSDWKEEGGYGFVSMQDGRRAYIHRSAFGGVGSLTAGMCLQVTTQPDPRNPGKWCVGEVLSVISGDDEPDAKRARF